MKKLIKVIAFGLILTSLSVSLLNIMNRYPKKIQ
ncbi:truncated membrane protein [Mycoplasma capricolum subsp. capricolum ATCC 27343]|uniref:Truncated membrane protein n=1 Tax=Mycoplasma capricolum subsp. capricolum (strain California kid / ATCC 27343 / NCTC 10154) TaxID=340047 RepID=Q2SSV7_MYCCT|nr:truncated membrane protein [Mycoplasma capricolum subsp. capricolum ATCC 27343]